MILRVWVLVQPSVLILNLPKSNMKPEKWIPALAVAISTLGAPGSALGQQGDSSKNEKGVSMLPSVLLEQVKQLLICKYVETPKGVEFDVSAPGASLIGDQNIFSGGGIAIKKGGKIVDHTPWEWLPYGPCEILIFKTAILPGKAKDYTVVLSFCNSQIGCEEIEINKQK